MLMIHRNTVAAAKKLLGFILARMAQVFRLSVCPDIVLIDFDLPNWESNQEVNSPAVISTGIRANVNACTGE